MQYATLGRTGLLVSRLAIGAMTFTDSFKGLATIQKVESKLADNLVGRAFDAGINFFDTADIYANGESEIVLGKALKSRRHDAVLASKVGIRSGGALTQSGLSRRHILFSIDESLKRLGTDWVDVYIAHREDKFTPLEETLDALDAVVRSGKARYIGFSNWSAWQAAAALEMQKANGWARFTHGQMHYSLLGRDVERDVIPMMRNYGLGMTVWSPLAFGFLTGKFNANTINAPDTRFSETPLLPFDQEEGFKLLEKIRKIASNHQASLAQVAIAWLLARDSVTSILVGTTKIEQLDDNLGALNVNLTPEEIADLEAATAVAPVYPNWFIDSFVDSAAAAALGRTKAE